MTQMKAKILLWGIAGSGKSTTLKTIHDKLRADLRGELRFEPTRLDPTIHSEVLPITLGNVGGVGTQIEIIAVPGAEELSMTRKQLLDEVDGLILVLDCSPERINSNSSALEELRASLDSYGRSLDSFPVVLQYNKRDLADPFEIESLHRRLGLDQAAVFETIATTGHGILATLTTISKHVVRTRRGATDSGLKPAAPKEAEPAVETADAVPEMAPVETATLLSVEPIEAFSEDDSDTAASYEVLEAAILAEGEAEALDDFADAVDLDLQDDLTGSFPEATPVVADSPKPEALLGDDLRIVSVGQATVEADGGVRLPIVLGDGDGQSRSVVLSLRLDALTSGGDD